MPEPVSIALGSENPVKARATRAAATAVPGVTVSTVAVDSGVAAQPIGHAETRRGARNRAEAARIRLDADLGVGIEGGIADASDAEETFVIMWVALTDGERVMTAAGPAIPLPAGAAAAVREGRTLGAVIRDHAGAEADDLGAAGVYTAGFIDREAALRTAVLAVLGRWVHDRDG